LRHSLCSLKDGTVVLIGGRMSPIYSCTQVIKLRLVNPEIKNCENLNKIESETEKLKNEMTNSKSTDLNCDARNLNKDLTGFTKLHMGLVVVVKKISVLINFLLQNTNLVSVLSKIPILCQSLAKYQSCVSP
jgi:hypothetical protein